MQRTMSLGQAVKVLRLILLALIGGIVLFTAIAWFADIRGEQGGDGLRILLLVVYLLAVCEIAAYLVLRAATFRRLRARLRAKDTMSAETARGPDESPNELFALAMIAAALSEGVALFAIVVFMLTRESLILIVPAVAVLILALLIPSEDRWKELLRSLRKESH